MGRRFRRLRQIGQQLVKVTRRIAQICQCCGRFPSGSEDVVVPVALVMGRNCSSILNNMVADNHICSDDELCSTKVICSNSKAAVGRNIERLAAQNIPNVPVAVYSSSDSSHVSHRDITKAGTNMQGGPNGEQRSDGEPYLQKPGRVCVQIVDSVVSSKNSPVDDGLLCKSTESCVSSVELDLKAITPLPPPIVRSSNFRVEHAFPDLWRKINPSDWTVTETLSHGYFGIVQLVVLKENGQKLVVKTCDAAETRMEAVILMDCQSRYVVKLYASMVMMEKERYLCLRYYEMGDLHHWLQLDEKRKFFVEEHGIWITSYLLVAVQYLHDIDILHLDIKPLNILIDNNGYPLLSDFGSARRTNDGNIRKGLTVTYAYCCPQLLRGDRPTELADLWAIACSFYEIVTGRLPFGGYKDPDTQLRRVRISTPDFHGMSSAVVDFLTSELHLLKSRRLGYYDGASSVMRHQIFGKVEWENVLFGNRQIKSPLLPLFDKLRRQTQQCHNQSNKQIDGVSTQPCRDINDVNSRRRNTSVKRFRRKVKASQTGGLRDSKMEEEAAYFGDDEEGGADEKG